jgi:hypothetical protein
MSHASGRKLESLVDLDPSGHAAKRGYRRRQRPFGVASRQLALGT